LAAGFHSGFAFSPDFHANFFKPIYITEYLAQRNGLNWEAVHGGRNQSLSLLKALAAYNPKHFLIPGQGGEKFKT